MRIIAVHSHSVFLGRISRHLMRGCNSLDFQRSAVCISPRIDWNHFLHCDKNPLPSPFHLIVLLIIGLSQIQRTGVIIILMHPLCVRVHAEECFGVCREKLLLEAAWWSLNAPRRARHPSLIQGFFQCCLSSIRNFWR